MIQRTNPGNDNKHELLVPMFLLLVVLFEIIFEYLYEIIHRAENNASPKVNMKKYNRW